MKQDRLLKLTGIAFISLLALGFAVGSDADLDNVGFAYNTPQSQLKITAKAQARTLPEPVIVECKDAIDQGIDPLILGDTRQWTYYETGKQFQHFSDTCWIENEIIEYYCAPVNNEQYSGTQIKHQIISCSDIGLTCIQSYIGGECR